MTADHHEGWVIVDGPEVSWAVDARRVSRIVARDAWGGAPPVDVAEALGARGPRRVDGDRVVVVDTGEGSAALLATGSLSLESAARAAILPLPPLLHAAGCADALRGLLLRGPGEARFVIATDRLSPAHRSPEEDDS